MVQAVPEALEREAPTRGDDQLAKAFFPRVPVTPAAGLSPAAGRPRQQPLQAGLVGAVCGIRSLGSP
jgi:hypothetical protein